MARVRDPVRPGGPFTAKVERCAAFRIFWKSEVPFDRHLDTLSRRGVSSRRHRNDEPWPRLRGIVFGSSWTFRRRSTSTHGICVRTCIGHRLGAKRKRIHIWVGIRVVARLRMRRRPREGDAMACFWSRVYQCNSRLKLSFRTHADAPDMSSSASQKRRLIARFRLAANATAEASVRPANAAWSRAARDQISRPSVHASVRV